MSDHNLRELERAALASQEDDAAQLAYADAARRQGLGMAVERWLKALQDASDEYFRGCVTKHVEHDRTLYTLEHGKRYTRVVAGRPYGSRSVYCFIDQTNGDILKAAGWKGPAKNGARGSVYRADCLAGCGPYGVAYLKGGGNYRFINRECVPSPLPVSA